MQQMLIDDRGASRLTPFEGGGDDEDIPDQAKDPGGEVEAQEEESIQKTFGRPTCFGRPTFGDDDGGMPIQKTPNRRQTSDGVRTSDTSDVRHATNVRHANLRTVQPARLRDNTPDQETQSVVGCLTDFGHPT